MKYFAASFLFFSFIFSVLAKDFEKDTYQTSMGELVITSIGHGTLMMEIDGKIIHIDPVSYYANYSTMPKADIILVTHEHSDHLDTKAIEEITKENTELILTQICFKLAKTGIPLKNGESKTVQGIKIDAVPAYNIKHMRAENLPYHPKGLGNGYVLHLGDKKVYVAGDTENTPEMKDLKNIDIAFLPMNLPYTMTPEMVADAALAFRPKILYPYHFGKTNTDELIDLLKDEKDIKVVIRKLE